jgi:hypothetical protein
MTIHRRVARLPPENYLGRLTYFVTICCDHRAPYLREETTAERVLSLLLECAASHSYRLHAYCLMPDHLHILVEGAHDRCDLLESSASSNNARPSNFANPTAALSGNGVTTTTFSGLRIT